MSKYIAFLRAINVAGQARVTMSDLKGAFAAAGRTGWSIAYCGGQV